MGDAALLNVVLFLPLLGVALLIACRRPRPHGTPTVAGHGRAVLLTAWLYFHFDAAAEGLQFENAATLDSGVGRVLPDRPRRLQRAAGPADGLPRPARRRGRVHAITKDVKLFYAMVFLIQFTMLGTFVAQDLFLFYLFWEAMLIPMFLIIGIWGGERRIYATIKFVLYTAFGSILMLAAVIYLVYSLNATTGITSFAFADLYRAQLPLSVQTILLAAFGLSFAIKVPIVPLHAWLPDAHVEAPTAGSVILAGVLLKMGTYGFMKLGFPLPRRHPRVRAASSALAVVSIIYGACLAWVQTDIKKIIAYSSISHLGYVMLGLISLDLIGIQGAIIQMVSHGLVAGGLFLMVGMVYERCHTRDLAAYGGLAKLLPVYAVFFALLTLASIGLPTTSGFTGEFLVLLGAFNAAWPQYQQGVTLPLLLSASAVTGVVLGALYMLSFAQRFLFGPTKAPHQPVLDLDLREKAILGCIVVAIFALGIFPAEPMRKTELAARQYQQLVASHRTGTTVALRTAEGAIVLRRWASGFGAANPRQGVRDELADPLHRDAARAHPARGHGRADRARNRVGRRALRSCVSVCVVTAATVAAVALAAIGLCDGAVPRAILGGARRAAGQGHRARAGGAGAAHFARRLRRRAVPYPRHRSLYGVCLLLSADSFLILFLGIELMSLPVYVLVLLAFQRTRKRRGGAQVPGAGRRPPRRRC